MYDRWAISAAGFLNYQLGRLSLRPQTLAFIANRKKSGGYTRYCFEKEPIPVAGRCHGSTDFCPEKRKTP